MTTEPYLQLIPEGKIVRREEASLWAKGDALLARTRVHADAMLAMARVSASEERARGFAAGESAARSEQSQLIIDAVARRDLYLSGVEKELIGVVANAVRKIVGDFDDFERTRIAVVGALKALRKQSLATVRVGPSNYDEIRAAAEELAKLCPNLEVLDVEMDPRLRPGACTLVSDIGVVESDVETQIRAIENAIGRVGISTGSAGNPVNFPSAELKNAAEKDEAATDVVWKSGGERRNYLAPSDRRRMPVTIEIDGNATWLGDNDRRKELTDNDRRRRKPR
ncbi:MAG: type III secretion system stator protein SctL [Pseudomonadota bacterium]